MIRIPVPRLAAILPVMFLSGCGDDKAESTGKARGHNFLLITLDTMRADHIGYHGNKEAKTPVLDALAASGVVFDDAQSQVPMTFPSHASILTGRYPREFGVRNNNQDALGTTFPTLATIYREHGYRTAAFVATFVLDSRFGLDRGFDVYDDEMSNKSIDVQPLEWEQPANVVADRAIQWLEANKKKPYFAWVHFYDPHDPYRPPAEFAQTYGGEVAFMDTQIKRIVDWVESSGLQERTLLMVVGDHGESFGEHGEIGHGTFLYQVSMHVPMLAVHPTIAFGGKRIAGPVALIDIFPTVLDLFGFRRPEGLLSHSFAEALGSGTLTTREVFSESNYAFHAYNWAEQRSLVSDQWRYISSTRPELYDRKSDPKELTNVLDKHREVAAEMTQKAFDLYKAMIPTAAGNVQQSAQAQAALDALGYVSGTQKPDAFLTSGLADPKDKMHVVKLYKDARRLMNQKRFEEAVPLLETVVAEAPDALAYQSALGTSLVGARRFKESLAPFKKALELDANFQPALIGSGDAHMVLRRHDEAMKHYKAATLNDPSDPTARYKLGESLMQLDQTDEAIEHYRKAIELFPAFAEPYKGLARALTKKGDSEGAAQAYIEAGRIKTDDPNANYDAGVVRAGEGKYQEAAELFRSTIAKNPNHGNAWINLGVCLIKLGKNAEGRDALLRAAEIDDAMPEAYRNLAIASAQEQDFKQAAEFFEKLLAIKPADADSAERLARYYLNQRRASDAVRILQACAQGDPKNVRIPNLLALVLATSNDDSVRNADEALRIAESLAQRTQSADPDVLHVLAAAQAGKGDFAKASETAEKALAILKSENSDKPIRELLGRHLIEYQAGRPIRDERF